MQLAIGSSHGRLPDDPMLEGVTMRLHRSVSAIRFERRLLAMPLLPGRQTASFDVDAIAQWRERGPATHFVDVVQQVVDALTVSDLRPNVRSTAKAMGVSVRTLQRWLAAEGSNFEALIGTSRLSVARRLLAMTDAKVVEIALELGYSDHAHFTRAFRRWTGVSPVAYRRAYLETSGDGPL
jgi:AraC-like DNA-binding protein